MSRKLTSRDLEVLDNLSTCTWVRPMDIGAHDGSYHSATLAKLARRGLVERAARGTLANERGSNRGSYLYRLTKAGCDALDLLDNPSPEAAPR